MIYCTFRSSYVCVLACGSINEHSLFDYVFLGIISGGVSHVFIGMPHRGRLNLLTDQLQYSPTALFHKV